MPSISQVTEIITNRTGLPPHIVTQSARRLREDELLPQSAGGKPVQIGPEHIASMLFASMTTAIVKDATRNAQSYGALVIEGGALDADGPPTTLLKHVAALIETAWANKTPRLELKSLTLDLMTLGATTTCRLADTDVNTHFTFVEPDADADEFRALTIRREVVLIREVFLNIIADLRKLEGHKRPAMPLVAKRWASR